mmetsp:Transcript_1806/g.2502  ORF Transcript_1806/g.2502 Transcript_1806/m.2502 type:complete len:93 (-) Transcript_1806:24-302(-)
MKSLQFRIEVQFKYYNIIHHLLFGYRIRGEELNHEIELVVINKPVLPEKLKTKAGCKDILLLQIRLFVLLLGKSTPTPRTSHIDGFDNLLRG